ncbi:pilus assembly PilX family protein [Acinetobacter bereziniae]|uniref:pilus assembly PilX family protein n=1 Tax=Acinetobacter bereziniae TaxID=106648 RepID=UPI0012501C92|nr:pilus assembly protein [Acinetobacter bereziniae]MBJ9948303.1 pilus assembly protein [Acinetobacter bereziniae]MCU4538878.1 pilus assembly protein [Acinetobacter bereziniae]MEC8123833.1 pilus assembly protein [Pseudomonadota bacterium]QQC85143.1 pilus assembly protein [Acinetobacter bereziniae]
MRVHQRGVTIIAVLFVLILMVLIGTLAVKQSLTGLNIATNSQIQSLNQQTADAVFFALEKDNKDSATLQKNLSSLGLFGIVKSDSFLNKELVFCYRPKTQAKLFSIQQASVIYPTSDADVNNSELGVAGYCQYTKNDYSSGRDIMISQIAVKKSSSNTDVPFKYFPTGTDTSTVQLDQVQPVQIIVTTIIPGAANGSGSGWSSFSSQINDCFKNHLNDKSAKYAAQKTVAECFADLGVPYSQQVMDYAVISYATKS